MFFDIKRKSGKEDEFKKLFCKMYPALVRFAESIVESDDEAKDIVSEVMASAWNRFNESDEPVYESWLYASVRNACINSLKHRQVEQRNADSLTEATSFDMKCNYAEHERRLRVVEGIVGDLPEPTRTILKCCYWEKKTYKETAEQMGLSPDTIKKHISKALSILRSTFNERSEK